MLGEFLAVGEKFRVGPGSQFVKVHALTFSFGRYPLRVISVEEPVKTIS